MKALILQFGLLVFSIPAISEVKIIEKRVIDFGLISNENGICTMADNNKLRGSNGQTCSGKGLKGKIRIKGDIGRAVNISIFGSSANGVTFRPRIVGDTTRIIENRTIVFIVGELELTNVSEGLISISYSINVEYD